MRMKNGNVRTKSGQAAGTQRTSLVRYVKKPSNTDGFTRGKHPPDQIFQTPSRARSVPGGSGPRIGSVGLNGSFSSTTGHGGRTASRDRSQKSSGGSSNGAEGAGASGSFFTSRQQEPSSLPSHSGQHLGFSDLDASEAVQPGRRTSVSMKQTRIDCAEAGTSRTMQSNKPVAIKRRITALFETRLQNRRNEGFAAPIGKAVRDGGPKETVAG